MKLQNLLPLFAMALAPFALAEGDKPAGKGEHRHEGGKPHGDHCEGKKPCGAGLDDAEKAKMKAAHETAAKDPAFVAAKDAVKAAHEKAKAAREKAKESKSDEDKAAAKEAMMAARDAGKAAMEAHKAAMLKADPSIAETLGKIEKAREECKGDKCDGDKPCKGEREQKREGKGKGKGPEAK